MLARHLHRWRTARPGQRTNLVRILALLSAGACALGGALLMLA